VPYREVAEPDERVVPVQGVISQKLMGDLLDVMAIDCACGE
jgi:hypothetical protein